VFDGADDNQYPNGTRFNINDLIAPVILREVYDKNSLQQLITHKAFVSAFSVDPYTPDREFIWTG
jgi:hypothetical protein